MRLNGKSLIIWMKIFIKRFSFSEAKISLQSRYPLPPAEFIDTHYRGISILQQGYKNFEEEQFTWSPFNIDQLFATISL